jgi:hypothetical protein
MGGRSLGGKVGRIMDSLSASIEHIIGSRLVKDNIAGINVEDAETSR